MLWERHHHGAPLIEPGLLTNRSYTSGILVVLAFFGAFGGLLLCVSIVVQLGEGFSPIRAGLTLTAIVVGMIAGMIGGTPLVKRLGRHLLHAGVLVVAAGSVTLALTVTGAPAVSLWDLAPSLFLIGVGAGASLGQLFDFILAGVTMRRSGLPRACSKRCSSSRVPSASRRSARSSSRRSRRHSRLTPWRSRRGRALCRSASRFLLLFMLPMRAHEQR
jgi:hypothetical protein